MASIVVDVLFENEKAGELKKENNHYEFKYDRVYLQSSEAKAISWSFPLTHQPYKSKTLFAFFSGLVSEGWLQKIQGRTQKIDEKDYFNLLVENGEDLIGAVSIRKRKIP